MSPQYEFAQALRELGLDVDVAVMNGEMQRVPLITKQKNKDGAYCGYLDGVPAGWAINYVTGEKIKFVSQSKPFSNVIACDELEQARKQKLQERESEKIKLQNEVAQNAQSIFERAKEAVTHPYLQKKGIKAYGSKVSEKGYLLIAIRNVNNEIRGLQYINEQGYKFFLKGMEKQGNFAKIGGQIENTVLICEGFATGASLYEATNFPVVIALDKGNLLPVSQKIRVYYPKVKIYLCADNDHELPIHIGNVGIEYAKKACLAVNGILKHPKIAKSGITDFNDIHKEYGLDEVRKQFEIWR